MKNQEIVLRISNTVGYILLIPLVVYFVQLKNLIFYMMYKSNSISLNSTVIFILLLPILLNIYKRRKK